MNLFVVLLIMVGVGALPAVADSGSLPIVVSCDTAMQVQLSSDSRLIEIGRELSAPPVTSTNSIGVKQLPAIPATFFMVLTGFVCVSLVKDRKLWLKVAFGVLYLGTVGINVVPQLLFNPENIKVNQSSTKGVVCRLIAFVKSQCDAQVTRYIGLLHRVTAIPSGESFAGNHDKSTTTAAHCLNVLTSRFLRLVPMGESLYSYLFAIIKNPCNSQFSFAYSAIGTQNRISPSQALTSLNKVPQGFVNLPKNDLTLIFKQFMKLRFF